MKLLELARAFENELLGAQALVVAVAVKVPMRVEFNSAVMEGNNWELVIIASSPDVVSETIGMSSVYEGKSKDITSPVVVCPSGPPTLLLLSIEIIGMEEDNVARAPEVIESKSVGVISEIVVT